MFGIMRKNATRGVKRRTLVFNVDVARRRRAREESSRRLSWRGSVMRVAVAGLLCALVILAGYKGASRLLQPSGFTVRWVEVSNTDLLSKREVLSLAGVRVGDSLVSVDIAKIRRRLCAHPDVRDAVVTRKVPGRIGIRVYERFPIAAIHFPSFGRHDSGAPSGLGVRRYVLDEEGYVLSHRKEVHHQSLPYLLGVTAKTVRTGDRLSDPAARKALDIVRYYRETSLCRQMELVSVDVSDPENYLLRSVQIQEVRLGTEDLKRRLELLSYILAQRKQRGLDAPARYLDLRWQDAAEMPLGKNIVSMR